MEASTTTATATAATEEQEPQRIKNRASAHSQVAQQWATRRLSASERPSTTNNPSSNVKENRKPPSPPRQQTQPQQQQQDQVPSLCYVIGKAWQEALEGISKQLPAPLKPSTVTTASTAQPSNLSSSKKGNKKEKGKSQVRSFPSVLQILQANALHQQVEHFQVGQQHQQQQQPTQQSSVDTSLQILPQGYNFHRAIVHMAQSRSRAFLLLDLASIVPTLVHWKQTCKSKMGGIPFQFLYTVQYNADPKLLQLLLRSNVGLVCTNKWDLERSRQALEELSTTTTYESAQEVLYDNAATTGKPDGYLRHLILDAQVETVVVDGPDEVMRIAQALRRMLQRRQRQGPLSKLHFLLRLSSSTNTQEWKQLVRNTQQAIADCREQSWISEASLVGLSADVSHATPEILTQLKELLLQDLTGSARRRLDLTGVTMPPTLDMLDWWKQLSSTTTTTCNIEITVDVSHALISPAGALCTRIIGVKEEQDETTGVTKRHYYIDDGCYGSLYSPASSSCTASSNDNNSSNSISNPLPLLYDEEEQQQQDSLQQQPQREATTTTSKEMYTSTVWGPTCDGLDKVSHEILLPKLHRDSWLVFPNLGCRIGEGLGTAFNGFAPPDTAYCVLGYFGK